MDDRAKVVEVVSHPAGRLPKFDRLSNEAIHDRVAAEMRLILRASQLPPYLDQQACLLLTEGRQAYEALDLERKPLVAASRDTHAFTWRGTNVNSVLAIMFAAAGIQCEVHDVGVTLVDCTPEEARAVIGTVKECPPIEDLAEFVGNLRSAKYDDFVPEHLLKRLWARRNQDVQREANDTLKALKLDLERA